MLIAFDVSIGKSTMVIYDRINNVQFEGELDHTRAGFQIDYMKQY